MAKIFGNRARNPPPRISSLGCYDIKISDKALFTERHACKRVGIRGGKYFWSSRKGQLQILGKQIYIGKAP